HSITAAYNGDASFNTSTNSPLTQTVNKSPSATALTVSTNTTASGQPITFTATITGTNGTLTGTVTFKDGATERATNNIVSGVAAYTYTTFTVADHSITAVYNGDASFNTNTSLVVTQTVNPTASRFSVAIGNWNSTATWSAT